MRASWLSHTWVGTIAGGFGITPFAQRAAYMPKLAPYERLELPTFEVETRCSNPLS